MRIVLARLAIQRFIDLLLQIGILIYTQFIKVLQCSLRLNTCVDLFSCQVMKFHTLPHHVGQSFLESEWSIHQCCDTISKHLLQSSSAIANATKYEVIDAQEVKGDIQHMCLFLYDHRMRKLHHVVIDSDRYVAARCVAMREVPVLVGQHCAKSVLLEIVKNTDSQNEYSPRFIL